MGNIGPNFCNCSDTAKTTEHSMQDSSHLKFNNKIEKSKLESIVSDDLFTKKTRLGVSDAETGDLLNDLIQNKNYVNGMILDNNLIFTGYIINGKKQGKGLIKTAEENIVYDGNFKDDLYDGEGTLIYDNGYIYNGKFIREKRNGKGIIFSKDETYIYDGEWVNDCKSGHGTETYPDKSQYIGEFLNNSKNGKGKYFMNDGCFYEGEFKNDKIEGQGKFIWSPDKFYDGSWRNNTFDGFGIFSKKEKVYVGYFENGKKQGIGLYQLKNGNVLIGIFELGEIEGLSIIISNNGNEQLCFMVKSKPKVLISDNNDIKNLQISLEYKNLIKFYQDNKRFFSNNSL